MYLHLESAVHKILTHLKDAFLYFWSISGIDNVLTEFFIIDNLCFLCTLQHQHRFVMSAENIINVNTYKYFDLLNILQLLAKFEIARRAKETDNSQETVKIGHA